MKRVLRRPPSEITQWWSSISHTKILVHPSLEHGPLILGISQINYRGYLFAFVGRFVGRFVGERSDQMALKEAEENNRPQPVIYAA